MWVQEYMDFGYKVACRKEIVEFPKELFTVKVKKCS
jgi:hypothetical protein